MIIFIGVLFSVVYLVVPVLLMLGLIVQSNPQKTGIESTPAITIIVIARDEEKNIADCMNALLNQDFPKQKIQILIIDDDSRDNTYNIASSIASENPLVRVIKNTRSTNWKSRKKEALHQALHQAAGEFLFLTDADCRPGKSWIKDTLAEFDNTTGLVAGFSPQQSTGSSIWNGFLFADSLSAAFASAATIGLKRGVTCTGRNLAIRTQAVKDIGGYQYLPDSVSGDDDFILFQITRHPNWNVRYSFHKSTHVPAFGPENFSEFLRQKKRHISAGRYFDPGRQAGYGIYHLTNFGLWFAALMSFWTNHFLIVPLLFKILVDWIGLRLFTKKLSLGMDIIHFLIWEFLFPVYHILAAPGAMRGKISWKEDR
ncbi:glycosyltransferase [candidate division KSB1 bacterium]|nr:glycosyltransferase [candidate division KSB1 bacterium]